MEIYIFFHVFIKNLKKFFLVLMNPNKVGRDMDYDAKDLFFSDSHIITVSIISLFAIILAMLGLCFFLKLCKLLWMPKFNSSSDQLYAYDR